MSDFVETTNDCIIASKDIRQHTIFFNREDMRTKGDTSEDVLFVIGEDFPEGANVFSSKFRSITLPPVLGHENFPVKVASAYNQLTPQERQGIINRHKEYLIEGSKPGAISSLKFEILKGLVIADQLRLISLIK
jgi:hypothetical protein